MQLFRCTLHVSKQINCKTIILTKNASCKWISIVDYHFFKNLKHTKHYTLFVGDKCTEKV